jgi:hypothetical protein
MASDVAIAARNPKPRFREEPVGGYGAAGINVLSPVQGTKVGSRLL